MFLRKLLTLLFIINLLSSDVLAANLPQGVHYEPFGSLDPEIQIMQDQARTVIEVRQVMNETEEPVDYNCSMTFYGRLLFMFYTAGLIAFALGYTYSN